MKLSTQTDVMAKRLGEEQSITALATAGYDAIDISCFEMFDKNSVSPKNLPTYKEYAKKLKSIADDAGVYFNQAHAPFPSSRLGDEEFDKYAYEAIIRSMEFCAIAGVRNIVVHPKHHLTYNEGDNARILKDINVEFYNSLIPYCKDFGITVCLENMWQYDKDRKIIPSACSSLKEFNEYLDLIDSPYVQGCIDIGHATLTGENIPEFINGLGKRLKALHVHDALGNWDFHRAPYMIGGTDWAQVMKALKEADYEGELTFEADNTLIHVSDDLLMPTAEYMVKIGRSLIKMFDNF